MIPPAVALLCLAAVAAVRVEEGFESTLEAERLRRQEAFQGSVLQGRYVLEGLTKIPKIPFVGSVPGWSPPELKGFAVEKHLGLGGLGDVWRARDEETGTTVALKLFYNGWKYISKATASPEELGKLESSDRECKTIMHIHEEAAKLASPEKEWAGRFCRCLADHIDDGEPSFLVVEDCGEVARSSLPDGREDHKTAVEALAKVRHLVKGVVRGIAVLSSLSPPYMHRDLKAENVCVNKEGEAEIVDWADAIADGTRVAPSMTPYMPPEAMNTETAHLGEAWTFDMYSAGLVYIELLCTAAEPQDWFHGNVRVWSFTNAEELVGRKCRWVPYEGAPDIELIAKMVHRDWKQRLSPWDALKELEKLEA